MGGGARIGSVRFPDMRMTGFTTPIWDGLMRWEISRKVFGYGCPIIAGSGHPGLPGHTCGNTALPRGCFCIPEKVHRVSFSISDPKAIWQSKSFTIFLVKSNW